MNSSITIPTPDGSFAAYLAQPAATTAPAVVVCQEIFGINADMRTTCDELAAAGFLAVCPDLFWRLEPGVELSHTDDWPKALALYQAYELNTGVLDVAATMEAARGLPGASGKVGVMGYCLGGLMTFLTAARVGADAAVTYYGGRTDEFIGEAATLSGPYLMHLGEEDEFISKDAQRKIALGVNGKANVELHRYPGCRHAFARHGGTHYDAAAAAKANTRTMEFLRANLAA